MKDECRTTGALPTLDAQNEDNVISRLVSRVWGAEEARDTPLEQRCAPGTDAATDPGEAVRAGRGEAAGKGFLFGGERVDRHAARGAKRLQA